MGFKLSVAHLRSFAVLLTVCAATLQSPIAAAQHPGADRAAWVQVTHQLESSPVDASINHDAQIAVQEINNAPDFHVMLCSDFFSFFGTNDLARYPYHAQIYLLYVLGAAAYQVDTGRLDIPGSTTSGLKSVLRGYAHLLRVHPEFRSRQLDDLTVTALSGKLDAFVAKKGCAA